MPKAIKGNAARTPPQPTPYHSDIEEWRRRLVPGLQPIIKQSDESIRAAIPDLHYAVKWKRAYYGLPALGWIIELAACDVSVNVLFLGGADFQSPPRLERPTAPGTSRSPVSRTRSDQNCRSGSNKPNAFRAGREAITRQPLAEQDRAD